MGNLSSKDGHGPPGPPLDLFHTPPTSPVSPPSTCAPDPPQLPSSPRSSIPESKGQAPTDISRDALISSPLTALDNTSSHYPSKERTKLNPPASLSPVKVEAAPSFKRESFSGARSSSTQSSRSSSASVSSPRTPLSPGKATEQHYAEKDSGIDVFRFVSSSGSGIPSVEEDLIEECWRALAILSPTQPKSCLSDLLRSFLAEREQLLKELQTLKDSFQEERVEWEQFQADMQVAVTVADRLRAEAEDELSSIREALDTTQRQLADAQSGQRKAESQVEPLRARLEESQQKLALASLANNENQRPTPNQTQGGMPIGKALDPTAQGPQTLRGRERGSSVKSVLEGYMRNLSAEDKKKEEPRKTLSSDKPKSLSTLSPSVSVNLVLSNGTSTVTSSTGLNNKSKTQVRVRRGQDKQENLNNNHSGKQEEFIRPPISDITDPLTVTSSKISLSTSQDDFNRLLRRHGGSKRNSLLRWCQSRTQGYKNIEITNFSSSWADGLAFCAVYHTYLPSHIPYSGLSPDNKKENLTLAFQTGEGVGIGASLTVDEMLRADGPDWQRVLGYVESIYRHFEM